MYPVVFRSGVSLFIAYHFLLSDLDVQVLIWSPESGFDSVFMIPFQLDLGLQFLICFRLIWCSILQTNFFSLGRRPFVLLYCGFVATGVLPEDLMIWVS